MDKKQFEKYLNLALSTGADFAELYHEKRINKIKTKNINSFRNNGNSGIDRDKT